MISLSVAHIYEASHARIQQPRERLDVMQEKNIGLFYELFHDTAECSTAAAMHCAYYAFYTTAVAVQLLPVKRSMLHTHNDKY